MALKIIVQYKDQPLVYNVTRQEENVYQLRLQEGTNNTGEEYVPEKLVIRKKGMIWVSDLEDHRELVATLTNELTQFNSEEQQLT